MAGAPSNFAGMWTPQAQMQGVGSLGWPGGVGEQAYTSASGTFSWYCPPGVTSVSVICVGGGSRGGGGLGYINNYAVTPGTFYTVSVGAGVNGGTAGTSYFNTTSVVRGGGAVDNAGGTYTGTGGGNGGSHNTGGGGAGGYASNGGSGGNPNGANGGSGGGGGGGTGSGNGNAGGGGGGVGIYGQGTSGSGGTGYPTDCCGPGTGGGGGGGSGGEGGSTGVVAYFCNPTTGGSGGLYGGGSGTATSSGTGARGAVRIIWPGNTRSFPSTNVGVS